MIADQDIYADKYGRITDDPAEFALQVAVKGCYLDERVARRYGIADTLVSTGEPNAMRRVTGRNSPSIMVIRAEEKVEASPAAPEPQEPAEAVETKKPAAKKGEKKTS